MRLLKFRIVGFVCAAMICGLLCGQAVSAQPDRAADAEQNQETNTNKTKERQGRRGARPVTIPIAIRPKDDDNRSEIIDAGNLTVTEEGETRPIISLRNTANTPLQLAVLIQDDAVGAVNNELNGIRDFIRGLPRGTRVMVGYLRTGDIQVRQKFTDNLEQAADSLRIVTSSTAAAPFNPYVGLDRALGRFENQPTARRAVLLVSDGLDTSRGIDSASPRQSVDLDRAIARAQRNGVAVYSFYAETVGGGAGNSVLSGYGQGSLNRLADETGGKAFFQGTSQPVSYSSFIRELNTTLSRQFALTFFSDNTKKDFRKIKVTSDNPNVEIEHPDGYKPR